MELRRRASDDAMGAHTGRGLFRIAGIHRRAGVAAAAAGFSRIRSRIRLRNQRTAAALRALSAARRPAPPRRIRILAGRPYAASPRRWPHRTPAHADRPRRPQGPPPFRRTAAHVHAPGGGEIARDTVEHTSAAGPHAQTARRRAIRDAVLHVDRKTRTL